jgi:predicted secreted protein
LAFTDKLKGTRFILAIGDGATPEVFTPMCGISEKGLQQTRQTSDTVDWDCADPDATPITVRDINQADWSASGSGLLHRPALATVQAAYDTTEPVNFRMIFDEATGDEVIDGYYQGPGVITDFGINGSNGQYLQISLTISGAGQLSFVANA